MKKRVNFNLNLRPVINKTVLILLLNLFLGNTIYAQHQLRIAGTVTDTDNVPIIGATVVLRDSPSVGTITDEDGKFSLQLPADAVLTVSFVGYQTQLVAVGGRTDLRITLQEDEKLLDEVVVVGYGTMRRSDLTGAIASIRSEELTKTNPSTLAEALQGKVAGGKFPVW